MQQLLNHIDGQFVPPKAGKFLESFNPATGKPFLLVPDSGEEDIDAAVVAAKQVPSHMRPPVL